MFSDDKTPSLSRLSKNVYVLPLSTNIGVIAKKNGEKTDVFLIDSGNDDFSAKKILDSIEEQFQNATIRAIINTHSHADHCGGNPFIQTTSKCEIWTSRGEAYFMEYPEIETALIWGGTPVHDIRSKFLIAKPSHATKILCDKEKIALFDGITLEAVSLLGHYQDPLGFVIHDEDSRSVFFMGDAISGRNVIKRYWIQYLLDEKKTKESLKKIQEIKADFYVPGHGDFVNEIEGLVELNLIALLETEDMILDELKTPKTSEEILKAVADRNGIRLGLSQFVLIGSTLRSYLSGLYEDGKVAFELGASRMLWKLKK